MTVIFIARIKVNYCAQLYIFKMPFRARDLVGTDLLNVNTYPRGVDFPMYRGTDMNTYLNADVINLNDETKRYFDNILYGFITSTTYMPCVQKRYYYTLATYTEVITCIRVYDAAYDNGYRNLVDAAYIGFDADVDITDDGVCLKGAPAIIYAEIEVNIENIAGLAVFIPGNNPDGLDKPSGAPLAPDWISTKITRDDICDIPNPDDWQSTVVRDWIYQHDCEYIRYILHEKLVDIRPHNLHKIINGRWGYLEIEYL